MITLRSYQLDAVNNIRAAFASGVRRVLFTAPCGSGKTIIFSYIAEQAARKDMSVLLLAHRQELIEQISESLTAFKIPHGKILAGRVQTDDKIQVGMILTTGRRTHKLKPDLIIHDECHRSLCQSSQTIFNAFPLARILGVTATPGRTDGAGLGTVYQRLITGPSTKKLIEGGFLAPHKIFCPPSLIDLKGVDRIAGDYNLGELDERLRKPGITGDAIEHYMRISPDKQFVVFCVSRNHAAEVSRDFIKAGIPCDNIDGSMNKKMRDNILSRLRSGALQGVTSCDLISEGFDLPAINTAILLRPTQSLIVYIQQVGRALRPAEGKTAIILDHCNNVFRHGLPDENRKWSLEGIIKKTKESFEIRRCKICFAVYKSGPGACPMCGAESLVKSKLLKISDGELVEITAAMIKEEKFRGNYEKCHSIEDIKIMARARGYKSGWAIRQVMFLKHVNKYQAAILLGYKRGAANYVY
jgi:superfamily II DNA or RNA helicase